MQKALFLEFNHLDAIAAMGRFPFLIGTFVGRQKSAAFKAALEKERPWGIMVLTGHGFKPEFP